MEARPATARIELRFRAKQLCSAADALVGTGRLHGLIFSRKRRLSTLLTCHIILIGRELLLPIAIVLDHFFVSHLIPPADFPLLSDSVCTIDVTEIFAESGSNGRHSF